MADKPKITCPVKRRNKLKAETQADYRERLNLGRTISDINSIENHLQGHARGLKTKHLADPQAMRWVLDSKWKRLGKLMPDLKQLEADLNIAGAIDHSIEVTFRESGSS